MAKFFSELGPSLQKFIGEQKLFFTATAPESGRINLSPKGIDTFRCLDSTTVSYLDLTGSGNETAAHLAQAGRMTIMFCSFDRKPLILRLYGKGEVVARQDPRWDTLHASFEALPGERQIVLLHIESVQTSCGYGVPVYELKHERKDLITWSEKKGEAGLQKYRREKNSVSIDGLPTGLPVEKP